MARPKRIESAPVSNSTAELLERLRSAVEEAGLEDADGNVIDDFDPLTLLAKFAADKRIKWDLRIAASRELAGYIYPKLSSATVSATVKQDIRVSVEDREIIGYDSKGWAIYESGPQVPGSDAWKAQRAAQGLPEEVDVSELAAVSQEDMIGTSAWHAKRKALAHDASHNEIKPTYDSGSADGAKAHSRRG